MSEDKRRDPRFDSDKKLWCEGQDASAVARNMSRSGMLILGDADKEVGDHVKVAFESEEGRIELNMQVMWRSENEDDSHRRGLGLKIVGFEQGEEAYDHFVQRNLEQRTRSGAKDADSDADGED
ncbi:MAG: PilZ domain-containing protein [Myxococcales bacterium]|nr:PilZ domain-containing protein [Myxococcales bacterium]